MFLLFAQGSYNNNFFMHVWPAVKFIPTPGMFIMLISSVSLHEIDGEDAEDQL